MRQRQIQRESCEASKETQPPLPPQSPRQLIYVASVSYDSNGSGSPRLPSQSGAGYKDGERSTLPRGAGLVPFFLLSLSYVLLLVWCFIITKNGHGDECHYLLSEVKNCVMCLSEGGEKTWLFFEHVRGFRGNSKKIIFPTVTV